MTDPKIEPDTGASALSARLLASGPGWGVSDVVCMAGPGSRPFEERHAAFRIAVVTSGTFQYRSSVGDAVLGPGALMLGGPGICFQCGHEHGKGDRCLSFHFTPAAWEEIVAATPGAKRGAVTRPSLPPAQRLAPLLAEAEAARDAGEAAEFETLALRIGGAVAAMLSDAPERWPAPNSRDVKRVTAALRRIEACSEEPAGLSELARDAAMSRYHFLRTFRRVVGMAPHQYLLRTRLHRAAVRLRRAQSSISGDSILDSVSVDSISAIAFDAGFNDLSTFNRRFKKVMGVNPTGYRARGSRR